MTSTRTSSVPSVKTLLASFAANAENAHESVVRDYRDGDKGTKAAIRTNVRKAFESAFDSDDFDVAKSIKSAMSDLTTTPEKAPVDVSAQVGTLVANHLEAVIRLVSGNGTYSDLPDGTDIPTFGDESVVSMLSDLRDGLDIPAFDDKAVEKAVTVKCGRKARSNAIPDMLLNVFETVESGTFLSTSDIRRKMAEMHPDADIDGTWGGRIEAALFRGDPDLSDILPVRPTKGIRAEYGRNGAIKA